MKNLVDREDGIFYALADGFVVLTEPVGPCVFERGEEVKMVSMFSVWELKIEGRSDVVGYFLYTALKVKSGGGYLVTFMESKRGKATESSVVFRSEHMIVYHLNGCGSMAITTKVNPRMMSILMEQ